jgi:NADPH2:quinone reductase
MRAIRVSEFGPPEVLEIGEVPLPEPGDGEYVVRIFAAGVNPVDAYIRSGTYARKPALPYTPGSDGAGTIETCGRGANRFKPGDRVYLSGSITGTYAEAARCAEAQMHPLGEAASFAQGAALGVPYATAYRALVQRGRAVPGETVLVHGGTGGVGIAAVQFARAMGLRVLATGGTRAGCDEAARQGAHATFDHHRDGYASQIIEETDGQGVNLILEMLANVNLARDLTLLAPRGRVVVIGNRGAIEINPRDAMSRDADILGMVLFNATPAETASAHAAIVAGIENRTLRPVIGNEFALGEAAQAHETVMRPGALGKIVLAPYAARHDDR